MALESISAVKLMLRPLVLLFEMKGYFYLFMAKIFLPLLGIVNHFTFPFVKSFRSSFGKRFRFPFLTVVFLSVWNSQGA